jgi:hypothetical protein
MSVPCSTLRASKSGTWKAPTTAAAVAERARVAEAARLKAQHDQFLLSTYLSSKDIEQLRDERLGQIEGQIRASSAYIDSLGTRMNTLQERAMHFKPYSSDPNARRIPDELAEELVSVGDEAQQPATRAGCQAQRAVRHARAVRGGHRSLPRADHKTALLTLSAPDPVWLQC